MAKQNTTTDSYPVEPDCIRSICTISEESLSQKNVRKWKKALHSEEKIISLFDELMKEKVESGASVDEALDSILIEIRLVDDQIKK